jgi:hypothetical protein
MPFSAMPSFLSLQWRQHNTFLDFVDPDSDDEGNTSSHRPRAASAGPSFATYPSLCAAECEIPMPKVLPANATTGSYAMETNPEAASRKRGGGIRKLNWPCRAQQCDEFTVSEDGQKVLLDPSQSCAKADESKLVLRLSELCSDYSKGNATPQGQVQAQEDVTTVMLRNIACRYTKDEVIALLDAAGLKGKYNGIHLPMNSKRSANLGYAFISFLSPVHVQECHDLLDNQVFGPSQTTKRCEVTPAVLQGPKSSRKSRRRPAAANVVGKSHASSNAFDGKEQQEDMTSWIPETPFGNDEVGYMPLVYIPGASKHMLIGDHENDDIVEKVRNGQYFPTGTGKGRGGQRTSKA